MNTDEGLVVARRWLKNEQKNAANRSALEDVDTERGCTEAVLHNLDTFYATEPTSDPERVTRGPFSYRASNEKQRISRAREITKLVNPGPYEDPNYFAMLSFQFATAQLAFAGSTECPFSPDKLLEIGSRVIFGTVARPQVNAFANPTSFGGYYVIGLNSGIIDFVYQSAKAAVALVDPHRCEDGRAAVSASGDIDSVRKDLMHGHESVERLYKTLESYFYHGYPRASAYEAITPEHGPVLATIVPMAERWIIAHELGHAIAAIAEQDFFGAPKNPFRAEEFYADNTGTILTVQSAANFDGLPPDFSLGGADFALACLELTNRAAGIVMTGEEPSDLGGKHHPPNRERSRNNLAIFRRFFNIYDYGQEGLSLEFELRDREPKDHPFGPAHEHRVTYWGRVLFAMWPYIRDMLKEQHKAGRPLHPIWTA